MASRVLRTEGLWFDGKDDCVVVGLQPDGSGTPFTVYGWSEITIVEWIYAIRPKQNTDWSKTSMIGDCWVDYPSTFHIADNLNDYSRLRTFWYTRKPDGTVKGYSYDWISEVNRWAFIVRRFTTDREFSVWVNAVKKYSAIVPSNETTVLEWNPKTATYPQYYRRFVLGANVTFSECMTCMNDEVRIYKRALTDAEISEIYTKDTFIKDGLALCLPFHEHEGNIAHDVSGYGNHGTIYGASWVVKKALAR